jgi:hypothetical protein
MAAQVVASRAVLSSTELELVTIRAIGLWRRYINLTIKIMDIIHRSAFYLKHTMHNARTSQETLYVSATSLTG